MFSKNCTRFMYDKQDVIRNVYHCIYQHVVAIAVGFFQSSCSCTFAFVGGFNTIANISLA